MYYDKLERANYFLNDMASLIEKGEPADSRLVQFLLRDIMGDGGQWTMAMNVYKKYGAVPKDYYPETAASKNTVRMNDQLRTRLRQSVCEMYAGKKDTAEIIDETVKAVHRILTIHLGTPPTSFDWQWTDKDGKFHRDGEITPQQFWKKYVDAGLEDYVCLVDDPRKEHPKGTKIAIEHLGNVIDGDATEYLNVDTATDLFEYGSVCNVEYSMNKEERVNFADSAMNHAMAFVGVDVADDGKTTRRWRVENSWGEDIADKGFFAMSDDWFSEYVYEIAVPKSMLPEEYREALEKPAISLPAWDPMGALA